MKTEVEVVIDDNGKLYEPEVEEGINWTTERYGVPGKLTCKVWDDKILKMHNGDPIRLKINGKKIFYGFIFKIQRSSDSKLVDITAYDQLRYLKNKDTLTYKGKTASQLIKLLAAAYQLKCGSIADTKYKIPSRVEDNTTLFDIINNALTLTTQNKGKLYVMYDDFGKITLKDLSKMKVNLLQDKDTIESYSYTQSIDSDVYDQVKLIYDDEKKGKRQYYLKASEKNIKKWGVLQYFDKLQKGENGTVKAKQLLELYNHETKTLSLDGCIGDYRVRAGTLIPVQLTLGDGTKILNYMLVEKASHTWKESIHTMDLEVRGGGFSA